MTRLLRLFFCTLYAAILCFAQTSAANTIFTQSGTGAVARTVDGKLKDTVSVLDFIPVSEHAAIRAFTSTTNVTSYVQEAINTTGTGGTLYIPTGSYRTCNLVLPPSFTMEGSGNRITAFKATAGCTGIMVTDNGNAAGIQITGLTISGNGEAEVTAGLSLGHTIQFGTNGLIDDVVVRGAPRGTCFDINANVGTMRDLFAWGCVTGLKLGGSYNVVDGISTMDTSTYGIWDSGWGNKYQGMIEVEAPATGSIPIYASDGPIQMFGPIVSLAPGTTITDIINYNAPTPNARIIGLQIASAGSSYTNALTVGSVHYATPTDFIGDSVVAVGGFSGAHVGSASTATALAANGSNCTGGQVATGVDASGNAEGCTSNVPGTAATITGALTLANTPLTARGDLLIGTTTTPILGKLAKGTQYQTLQGGATDPGYDAVHLDRTTAVTGVLPAGNIAAALSSTTSVNGTTIPSGGVTLTKTIASGATAMGTNSIASGACASAVTATATGTLTTDVLTASFNGDPTAVTGYIPLSKGALAIFYYPTSGNVTFKVCNFTSSSITPGAITLNWRVVR